MTLKRLAQDLLIAVNCRTINGETRISCKLRETDAGGSSLTIDFSVFYLYNMRQIKER